MKLLLLTQIIDSEDTVLGFFHGWVKRLALKYDQVTVICLKAGPHSLPSNVKVLSLGKERGAHRLEYILRFYFFIIKERLDYDTVLVHMNQEYVLFGGLLWRLWGKKIGLWYNHTYGTLLTRIAYKLAHRIFYTSPHSFSARYGGEKSYQMSAGIDTDFFNDGGHTKSKPSSFLFLGRLSPVKKVDIFIAALNVLDARGVNFMATICGDSADGADDNYRYSIEEAGKHLVSLGKLTLISGVPHPATREIYLAHTFYINLTQTGSLDKTVLEAMACRKVVSVMNKSFSEVLKKERIIPEPSSAEMLADILSSMLSLSPEEISVEGEMNRSYCVEHHSLDKLVKSIYGELESSSR